MPLLLSSCKENGLSPAFQPNNYETQRFELLSNKTPCFSLTQELCLIRASNNTLQNFYNPIKGFDFIWGHSYILTLFVTEIENPPSDGSSMKYELAAIISDTEDDIGTRYEYEQIELLKDTFTKNDTSYYFLGQPFECLSNDACDSLIALGGNGGLINVTFEYLGGGTIALHQWN